MKRHTYWKLRDKKGNNSNDFSMEKNAKENKELKKLKKGVKIATVSVVLRCILPQEPQQDTFQ